MASFFDKEIECLAGVGPQRGALLREELHISTYRDLLHHYPFRYEDRTRFYTVQTVQAGLPYVQIKGVVTKIETLGGQHKKRLVAYFQDETGTLELVWFKGLTWIANKIPLGVPCIVFGKPQTYGKKLSIPHPELEVLTPTHLHTHGLQPVYSTTEKLNKKFLGSKQIAKLQFALLQIGKEYITEVLPTFVLDRYRLMGRQEALQWVHFPQTPLLMQKARYRLKFEELFYVQLQLLRLHQGRKEKINSQVYNDPQLLTRFYHEHLPFALTAAQKRVVKEIYQDLASGYQMNRLLQGDVGSGKTMVAFLSMLFPVALHAQAVLMAPTELLAEQHYQNLRPLAEALGLRVALLTGSTRQKERAQLASALEMGIVHILIGTHALIEDQVRFKDLGLAIIDEQHRFGVAQRAKLWNKNPDHPPHVLVMTATPIPRTLAMTLYGDLDVSVIDELPVGRKPIKTLHYYDAQRLKVFQLIREQLKLGRQVYIVYPLIEESEKVAYKDLNDGYESVCRAFPGIPISIVHGKMKGADKDYEMQQFARGKTKIMVATTVIEVGIDVPNATMMVIENAERFGLAQLHQLRGRVGRGEAQSYCVLMTDYKLSTEARERIQTMVRTQDGFEIADVDLRLRGPGDLMGVQQSGLLNLKIADLSKDAAVVQAARDAAGDILQRDPLLSAPDHAVIYHHLAWLQRHQADWQGIS